MGAADRPGAGRGRPGGGGEAPPADARAALLLLGRGLGYRDGETIELVERLTGVPWAACGRPELDATLAAVRAALAAVRPRPEGRPGRGDE